MLIRRRRFDPQAYTPRRSANRHFRGYVVWQTTLKVFGSGRALALKKQNPAERIGDRTGLIGFQNRQRFFLNSRRVLDDLRGLSLDHQWVRHFPRHIAANQLRRVQGKLSRQTRNPLN